MFLVVLQVGHWVRPNFLKIFVDVLGNIVFLRVTFDLLKKATAIPNW
jgi:hypothetical protein